jgi:hypothetical protein
VISKNNTLPTIVKLKQTYKHSDTRMMHPDVKALDHAKKKVKKNDRKHINVYNFKYRFRKFIDLNKGFFVCSCDNKA